MPIAICILWNGFVNVIKVIQYIGIRYRNYNIDVWRIYIYFLYVVFITTHVYMCKKVKKKTFGVFGFCLRGTLPDNPI